MAGKLALSIAKQSKDLPSSGFQSNILGSRVPCSTFVVLSHTVIKFIAIKLLTILHKAYRKLLRLIDVLEHYLVSVMVALGNEEKCFFYLIFVLIFSTFLAFFYYSFVSLGFLKNKINKKVSQEIREMEL